MANFNTKNIRNIAFVGHGGSGKTTLTEASLFISGAINRLGRVDEGNTTTDFDSSETTRHFSINSALAPLHFKNNKINIIDTPGFADFVGEVISALKETDNVLMVIDGVAGIQVQTEKIWQMAESVELPRSIVINRLDKEHSDFYNILNQTKKSFKNTVALNLPIGNETNFKGIVDLIEMKAYITKDNTAEVSAIPDDMKSLVEEYREKLIEAAAENDDALLEKYLDTGQLTNDEIKNGIKAGIIKHNLFPVFATSGYQTTGVINLLEAIINYLPSPDELPQKIGHNPKTDADEKRAAAANAPLSAQVFKTMSDPYIGKLSYFKVISGTLKADTLIYDSTKQTKQKIGHLLEVRGKNQTEVKEVVAGDFAAVSKLENVETGDTLCDEANPITYEPIKFPEPVLSFAISPKTKGDEEKLSTSLNKLAQEDVTLKIRRDTQTHQTVISGIGDMQIDIVTSKLKQKFGVEAVLEEPRIPYKETIKSSAKAQGKYKKQTGGRGQYGDVWLHLEPLEEGKQYEFANEIKGGVVPAGFVPAVEKGLHETMEQGVIAGYPVVDVKIALYDGSYHPVDSSEMAFKIASSMAFKKAFMEAKPVLLEPIVDLEIMTPDEFTGDIIADLSGRRGKILGMEAAGKNELVKAQAPLAEVARYAIQLRSITHGKGSFSMSFSHYDEVPPDVTKKLIEQKDQAKEVVKH